MSDQSVATWVHAEAKKDKIHQGLLHDFTWHIPNVILAVVLEEFLIFDDGKPDAIHHQKLNEDYRQHDNSACKVHNFVWEHECENDPNNVK